MTWNTGFKTRLPDYFYNIADPRRWYDEFAADPVTGEQREVLSIGELIRKRDKGMAYRGWLHRHELRSKVLKFQRIRIINDKDPKYTPSPNDWWPKYHGAIFTVFMQPETLKQGKNFIQFYVLCPEDCEMVLRYEHSLKNPPLPIRSEVEPYLSDDSRLRLALVVPSKCCHHLKNETFAGKTAYQEHL